MTIPEDYERLYDELSGHRENPPQSDEYNPDDPLGLSIGRISCTMRPLASPLSMDMAEVFVQDENGNWVEDEESQERRDMLMRSYRQWL